MHVVTAITQLRQQYNNQPVTDGIVNVRKKTNYILMHRNLFSLSLENVSIDL